MSALGGAIARVRSRARSVAALQAARVGGELALELGALGAYASGMSVVAMTLVGLRVIFELSVGSVTDLRTTRRLLGDARAGSAGEAVRLGLRRVGAPLALVALPAAAIAYFAARADVRATLAAVSVGLVAALVAALLHLRAGAVYATLDADVSASLERAARVRRRDALAAYALAFGALWAASAIAAGIAPHLSAPRFIAIGLASLVTRPFLLAVWIESSKS